MKTELEKNLNAREIETRIQKFWDENSFWDNDVNSDKKSFCIMMPPPNVTGNLHMGHALDNVLTDIVCRYKRMCGYNVLWQPGTDHASIATQLLVERDLSKKGINPRSLTTEELLDYAWKWKADKGGQIINQLHILGVTPAWKRERFTMDEGLSRAVTKLFVKMYNEGLIYREKSLVNWCPKQQTSVSDLEVLTREEKGKFYYFNYPLKDGGFIEIATTRPETLFGDQAIAIHPENEKLKHLIGKTAIIPLTDIEIPVIADEHADPGAQAVRPEEQFSDENDPPGFCDPHILQALRIRPDMENRKDPVAHRLHGYPDEDQCKIIHPVKDIAPPRAVPQSVAQPHREQRHRGRPKHRDIFPQMLPAVLVPFFHRPGHGHRVEDVRLEPRPQRNVPPAPEFSRALRTERLAEVLREPDSEELAASDDDIHAP